MSSGAQCSDTLLHGAEADRKVMNLNGWWHVWFDEEADWRHEVLPVAGTPASAVQPSAPSSGWQGLEDGAESLAVPGTWDESRPGYHGVAWHWRPVFLEEEWGGRVIRLRLEGVRLYCQVYVDGELVGYDYDGLAPFEVDVGEHLSVGRRHTLALRVVNPGGACPGESLSPIRWGGLVLPAGHDFGGVWGGASLVGTHAAFVESVRVEATPDGSVARFCVGLRNHGPERHVRLGVLVRGEGDRSGPRSCVRAVRVMAGGTDTVTLQVPGEGMAPWSPCAPRLHEAEVVLDDGEGGDCVGLRFGLRHLSSEGEQYLLNGRELQVRAARSAGWYPVKRALATGRLAEQEVRAARGLGLNALLLDGHVASAELLDAADREGLLVVQRLPGGSGSAELCAQRLARLRRRDGHRPSAILAAPQAHGQGAAEPTRRAFRLALDSGDGQFGPPVPILTAGPPGLPEVDTVLRRYGRRVLPASDGQVWASWAQEFARQHAAHRLGRLFSGPDALARATSRSAYRWAGEQVRAARLAGSGGGFALATWADDVSGDVGLVDPFRTLKSEGLAVAEATAALALAMRGLASQQRTGQRASVSVHALNRAGRRGTYELQVRIVAPDGRLAVEDASWATLLGTDRQPLERTEFWPDLVGEYVVRAALLQDSRTVCSAERSVWVTDLPPLGGSTTGSVVVLGALGAGQALFRQLGTSWHEYTLGASARALLVVGPEPTNGLTNVLNAGAVRRVALLWGEPSGAGMEHWARLVPQLGSAHDVRAAAGPPWVIGGWHKGLLSGVGDPGIWWHAGSGLRPRCVLREPLGQVVIAAVYAARRAEEASGGPQVGTVLGLSRVGEAELLVCTLPLLAGLERRQPAAERLLGNIVAWLLGAT